MPSMLSTPAPINTRQILTFHIKGWKTERDGKTLDGVDGTDTVYVHEGEGSVADTIEQVLRFNGLTATDVISISADCPTAHRDLGSWDFWLFCRNPNAAKGIQADG